MFFKAYCIRPATNDDIPVIKKIVFSSLVEHGLHPDPDGKDRDLDDIRENYNSGKGFFGVSVIRETSEIVGCFGLFPLSGKIGELRKMYLLKPYRGKGLGAFMLEMAIQIAREKNYEKIFLETISPLTAAISLYKKFGFKEVSPKEINERVDRAFELGI